MFEDIVTQQQLDSITRLLQRTERIVVIGHQNPDGDAVGAVLGFMRWASLINDEAEVQGVLPDAYPDFLQWLPCANTIMRYDKKSAEVSALMENAGVLVCLDFNDYNRVGALEPILREYKGEIIHIDHHLNPTVKADIVVSSPQASSTSEMVLKMVIQNGDFDKMNRKFYIPIFTGMMTDTGNFSYSNASPDTYYLVSELLRKKINREVIARNVYDNFSEWRLRLLGYVMNKKLVNIARLHASYFTLRREEMLRFNFIRGDAEGLVNMPLQIKGQKLSISLREDTTNPNIVWVSTRGAYDFPCDELCKRFYNGGGHSKASGGKIYGTIDDAVKITIDAINYYAELLK